MCLLSKILLSWAEARCLLSMRQDEATKSSCTSLETVEPQPVNISHTDADFIDPNYGDPNARPDIAVIPLALSDRGIPAIAGAEVPGLLDDIIANSRPIYTRMVQTWDSSDRHKEVPMIYGPQGQVHGSPIVTLSHIIDLSNSICTLSNERKLPSTSCWP